MDTGIQSDHDDFFNVVDFYRSGWVSGASDGWHGTHVASIIGGIRYGVVLGNQNIFNVNIFECCSATGRASWTMAHLIQGFSAIRTRLSQSGKRGVINMSFGTNSWDTSDFDTVNTWLASV